MMFTNFETLKCETCQKEFIGRRVSEGGLHRCLACNTKDQKPIFVLTSNDDLPPEVLAEFENARGEN